MGLDNLSEDATVSRAQSQMVDAHPSGVLNVSVYLFFFFFVIINYGLLLYILFNICLFNNKLGDASLTRPLMGHVDINIRIDSLDRVSHVNIILFFW